MTTQEPKIETFPLSYKDPNTGESIPLGRKECLLIYAIAGFDWAEKELKELEIKEKFPKLFY